MHFREGNDEEVTVYPGGGMVSVDSGNQFAALTGTRGLANVVGVYGYTWGTNSVGVYGDGYWGAWAGEFYGDTWVDGNLSVAGAITAGTKDFKIDHPLDPIPTSMCITLPLNRQR